MSVPASPRGVRPIKPACGSTETRRLLATVVAWTSARPALDQPWTSRGPALDQPTSRASCPRARLLDCRHEGSHSPRRDCAHGCAGVCRAGPVPRPRRPRANSGRAARIATLEDFDGGFQFCRIVFRQPRDGDGGGWNVDWPRADKNLSIRLSELTTTPVSMDDERRAQPLLVRADRRRSCSTARSS